MRPEAKNKNLTCCIQVKLYDFRQLLGPVNLWLTLLTCRKVIFNKRFVCLSVFFFRNKTTFSILKSTYVWFRRCYFLLGERGCSHARAR